MTLPHTTPTTPFVRINHPTHQACLTGSNPLRHDLQPQLIQARERGQIRANKGTVQHVEVSPQGYVRTPIVGRPRPPPHDHHTNYAHTRPTPCFAMSRGNFRWADEQFGITADWPPRYDDDDIWNLDAMIRNSQESERRGLNLGKQDR